MMEWLNNIVFWHWWILAGLLLILDLSAPAFLFLWLGITAAVTGFVVLLFPAMAVEFQWITFSIASIAAILAWRRYRETRPSPSDPPNSNRRGRQYIGRVFTLDQPIENGMGKVLVNDSIWRVKGPDLPAGAHVRVESVDDVVFVIAPIEKTA